MKWPRAAIARRSLLVGGGGAVGLVIAYSLWPKREAPIAGGKAGDRLFGPYLRIAPDGRVTVAVPQAETGQGAWTGLAQIAADELDARWDMVAIEPAPLDPGFANLVVEQQVGVATRITASSSSIRAFEAPLREAAAMARAMLCAAAASRLGIDPAQCDARESEIVAGADRLGFGDLAGEAAMLAPPSSAPLRVRGQVGLTGRSLPRLDLPAKANGSMRFAGDVRLPGMRFASIRLAPPGGRLTGFVRAAARRASPARLVVRDGWLAAIGETSWSATKALTAATPQFAGSADRDTPALDQAMAKALDGPMVVVSESGDYDAATDGLRPLAASYHIAPAPHLSLEPPSVAARIADGVVELWVGTQIPDLARSAAARAAGVAKSDVRLVPMPVGDGGGRAVSVEGIAIAVELARLSGSPILLTYPAATAQNHDALRPPLSARISALADPSGGLASWHARFAGAAGLDAALARAAGTAMPAFVPHGGVAPYPAAATRVEAATAAFPADWGYLRGDVEALTSFAIESFIDEFARARGAEPLAFRIGLLGGQPRLARVLTLAASKGGWDGGGRGSSLGMAGAAAYGSFIGLLAEATIGPDQRIAVSRLVAAVDCGRMINPDLVRQQIEGGLLHALVTASGPAPEIIAGMARARPLAALGLPTLRGLPKVDVVLVPSTSASGGVSGLGAMVLAAAVGNAIFAATGMRLRRLPFDPMSAA